MKSLDFAVINFLQAPNGSTQLFETVNKFLLKNDVLGAIPIRT